MANKKQYEVQRLDSALKNKEMAIQSVIQIEKAILDSKLTNFTDRRLAEELVTKKEEMEKELLRYESVNKQQDEQISKVNLEIVEKDNDIQEKKLELDSMIRYLQQVESEKEQYGKQAEMASVRFQRGLEEIKLEDNLISEFQKKNVEVEAKLREQQLLY